MRLVSDVILLLLKSANSSFLQVFYASYSRYILSNVVRAFNGNVVNRWLCFLRVFEQAFCSFINSRRGSDAISLRFQYAYILYSTVTFVLVILVVAVTNDAVIDRDTDSIKRLIVITILHTDLITDCFVVFVVTVNIAQFCVNRTIRFVTFFGCFHD